ncbi:hypothetical protein HRbin10_01297 [bacterium HR10]|nr:hypothetical protein HRbin10_01297 [bacterium HR10]
MRPDVEGLAPDRIVRATFSLTSSLRVTSPAWYYEPQGKVKAIFRAGSHALWVAPR